MSKRSGASFARRLGEAQREHAEGRLASAVRAFVQLNKESPGNAAILHPLGIALAQGGKFADAERCLVRAAELEPRNPRFIFDLGALREAQGRPTEAERLFKQVVEISPGDSEAWAAVGMYRLDANDRTGATNAYLRASDLKPERTDFALKAAEGLPPSTGADLLVRCLTHNPTEISLLLPLAELLMRSDRLDEAVATLLTLQTQGSAPALVFRHLGAIYTRLRQFTDAAASLEESIRKDNADPQAWSLLATVRDEMGDSESALDAISRALSLQPENISLIGLAARLMQQAGHTHAAQEMLSSLPLTRRETSNVRFLSAMLMPPILRSNEEIDSLRDRWMETMADIEARPTFISEPWESVALTGYFIGYQGREDRSLMEAWSRATLAASPHLDYTAPALGGHSEKIRVGFLSAYMRKHSVGRVLIDLMGALDRERFEVVLLQLPDKVNGGQELGEAAADRTVKLVPQLEQARSAVQAEQLDVLIYCDLHLNPFSDALSFSRLAPVQATTWGHPGTGGRSSIDYWISCNDWEAEGNERLYNERLVRLSKPPLVTKMPAAPTVLQNRESLGLTDDARLYGCLQSIFKLHPDMDPVFAAILERDPRSRIVVVDGPHLRWRELLTARFSESFDPSRIDFLPTLPYEEYLSTIAACDVMLDPIRFGGANTTLDAFSLGKPVVTLKGDQMRNRATSGFYRQMGYEELVAKNEAQYVDLAVRLAQDTDFYRTSEEAIVGNNHVLFDNLAPVEGFESWLIQAARG